MKTPLVRLASVTAFAVASCLSGFQISSFAQTSTSTQAHHTAPAAAAHRPIARPGCVALPTISTKIPAIPASAGCAKPLYTISSSASQLSPMLGAALRESLEKLNQTFTMSFIDTKVGTGALAQPKMYYTVNYTGYLTDGTKFDTSEGKDPITFPYGARRVIQGWDTGFEGMHVGGKRRLFVPYQLAYGEAGKPPVIPAKALLVFDIELVSQSDKPPAPKTPPTPPAGATGSTGTTGASGTTGATGAAPASAPGANTGVPHPITGVRLSPAPTTAPGAAAQPSTPPVTSTTPATPPSPTGSTTPKQ